MDRVTYLSRITILAALLLAGCAALRALGSESAEGADAAAIELFESRVRPVLVDRCVRCHGSEKRKSGLRLDSREAMLRGGERGPAIVPGDSERSPLMVALRYLDPELQMPPRGKLDDRQIAAFADWIDRGAPYPGAAGSSSDGAAAAGGGDEHASTDDAAAFDLARRKAEHWCFAPVTPIPPPTTAGAASPIDSFVLARLQEAGLQPAKPADRRTLIRRLHLDLHGLPPAPADVDAFVKDRSPDAYQKLVDRLLASARYGERFGRHWLDLMGFAETRGFEFDFDLPNSWHYRDYIIRALNEDVPYDQLVVEHVAGDLLEAPRTRPGTEINESILGTAFWFFGEEAHSPVDTRADEAERFANRIDVLTKSFLGLTVSCARCHDHKFDAISTKDFYSLYGFLQSSSYRQVRFETMQPNGRIARDLQAVRADWKSRVAAGIGETLRSGLPQIGTQLRAAADALGQGPWRKTGGDAPQLGRCDIIFEDFEQEDWDGWTVTGTAFLPGPVAIADIPEYQGEVLGIGRRVVNGHNTRGGENSPEADRHVGTLTSSSFRVERDYVHFLIGGGMHEAQTCVQLRIDGDIVRTASGRNSNRMTPVSLDVREFAGRTAAIVVVDTHTGHWGHIALDHIVFSDDPHGGPKNTEALAQDAAWWARARHVAAARSLDPVALRPWLRELRDAAQQPLHPLRPLALLATHAAQADGSASNDHPWPGLLREWIEQDSRSNGALDSVRVIVDYGDLDDSEWIVDGHAFGNRPVQAGDWLPGSRGELPVGGMATRAAAAFDSTWNILEPAADHQRDPGAVTWTQAGRTLRTPTFELGSGRLHYLVRGRGHVYAAVDSHRMLHGPLHLGAVRDIPETERFDWVTHDLGNHAGHGVHLEFSPAEAAQTFDIAMIVEADEPPRATAAPDPHVLGWLRELTARGEMPGRVDAAVDLFMQSLDDAIDSLADASSGHAESRAEAAGVIHWLIERLDRLGPLTQSHMLSEYRAIESSLVNRIQRTSQVALAIQDGSGVDERVMLRGSHRTPGELAPRRFLEAIDGPDALSISRGSGRLELARRLVAPDNPLIGRVLVNRVWHHLFGRGIVASVDNFGVLGERPSHPLLLDWLADDFIRQGWSIKKLVRSIVLSRTYRMSSAHSRSGDRIDPDNRLLHRMSVRRLDGEALRDSILAVSGRLDLTMYGPSVPVHLTEFMGGRGRPARSGPLDGDGRRSIYLSVRRNFLSPFLQVFDAPSPSSTFGRRTRSNVPAQSLTLMNDPFVVEQARFWADRLLASGRAKPTARVRILYEEAFSREPTRAELSQTAAFLKRQAALYECDTADPRVWADLCHVLFNVKEFSFRN